MYIPDSIFIHYKLILLALIVIICVVFIYLRYRKKRFARKIKRQVKRISYDHIENVILDGGPDDYAQFDYLLLTDKGIVILDIKDYAGHIFGADKINEWTQIINRRSYKFANPFFELSHKIELVKGINKDINVSGLILFTDEADFPKGCPDSVIALKTLKDNYVKLITKETPELMQRNWDRIKEKISANSQFTR